jgi:cell division protein FtsN
VPPASRTTAAKPEAAFSAEPAGDGYYVKVVAYRERSQAEKVARRLSGKGYSAYIVPLSGRGLYSVCVGKFKSRREADSTRRRLEKEEQFKPLISH